MLGGLRAVKDRCIRRAHMLSLKRRALGWRSLTAPGASVAQFRKVEAWEGAELFHLRFPWY